jgi:hypothetical protein
MVIWFSKFALIFTLKRNMSDNFVSKYLDIITNVEKPIW